VSEEDEMATVELWIQIENHAWDVAPNNIDRMTGETMQAIAGGSPPVTKTLISPESGVTRTRTMFKPLSEDALILRRYTANWAAPDDRKVNPWDVNEPDPTDAGTMGTIPGPVIECQVGDTVKVHFRNRDHRAGKGAKPRTHSLHPHGFVFNQRYDGAYPLSPPDSTQPVGGEAGWTGSLKQGDRVPPDGTFTYTWETFGWPTTSGVWLYHDHSICDMDNVQLGAIGIIVIHNPADAENEVLDPPLPGGSVTGSPVFWRCFPFPREVLANPAILQGLGRAERIPLGIPPGPPPELQPQPAPMPMGGMAEVEGHAKPRRKPEPAEAAEEPVFERSIQRGELLLELDKELLRFPRFCLPFYRDPPAKAQYLLLFHNLAGGAMMCINGRKFLGNTPTVVAGTGTHMRFGVVGMGNFDGFHTFHLHGHRWVIPGPDGNNPGAIQGSPQVTAVSQFEDTRTFGPANSFNFAIQQGSFMGSFFTPDPSRAPGLGEWHMHCHVLNHMMDGMMGSLLVVAGSGLALGLPHGEPCPTGMDGGGGATGVSLLAGSFDPVNRIVNAGDTVIWTNTVNVPHTVTSNDPADASLFFNCSPASTELFRSGTLNQGNTFSHTFNTPGVYHYHCEVHGCSMAGTITVT